MRLEAPYRFATSLGRTEIERGVFRWVVFPGLGQRLDDVTDLHSTTGLIASYRHSQTEHEHPAHLVH